MFGGFDGTAIQQQTFEFTGNVWSQITTQTAVVPPNATEAVHGFDPVRRRTVVFGGFGTTGFSSATYEFDGATTGFFSTSSVNSTSKRDCLSKVMASMYLSSVASTKNMTYHG